MNEPGGGGALPSRGIASFRTQVTGEGTLPRRLNETGNGIGVVNPSRFLSVIGLDDGCRFDGVFLNGLRSLRRFSIKNITGISEGVTPSALVSITAKLKFQDAYIILMNFSCSAAPLSLFLVGTIIFYMWRSSEFFLSYSFECFTNEFIFN